MNSRQRFILIRIILAALMLLSGFVLGILPLTSFLSVYFYILAAVIVGYDVLISAINGIVHGHMLDENFLMTAGSICAFILGEYAEGTFILLFYQVGELFQAIAVGKSRRSIAELMDIRPDYANLICGDSTEEVDPYDINIGDIIVVKPGEKIPLDGKIIAGSTTIDASSLTGESIPQSKTQGDEVISGCINLTSVIKIEVTKPFDESTVSKILDLVETAATRKAKAENFVTIFAKYYTPAVALAALLVGILPPLVFSANWSVWLIRAVMFVVISCPCALVVSVPLAFFGAIGGASRKGILVKGGNYLEVLSHIDTIIFDKTGTLTKGDFSVTGIYPKTGVTEDELIKTAAICETHSSHPIALSIKKYYGDIPYFEGEYKEIAGKGVVFEGPEKRLVAGSAALLKEQGVNVAHTQPYATAVHVASSNEYLGYILISDQIKSSAPKAISNLKKLGVARTVMLTGDHKSAAEEIARTLKIDDCKAELLPFDKVAATEEIIASAKGKVAFVGDGVNDAPVLARADIGIAMGALGSDAAIEAADIVIMNDDLSALPVAVKIARKAVRISKQNIALALIVKFSILLLSFIGISNIWMAVFADVGVLIIAIINSMRTLYNKSNKNHDA